MGLLWLKQRERNRSMPLPKSKIRITLDELDAPEFWVDIRLLQGMKYADVRNIFGEDRDEDKDDSAYVEQMMERMIIEWNIPEEEGGPAMPVPSQDIQSVGKLPNTYVNYIIGRMSSDVYGNVPDTADLEETS